MVIHSGNRQEMAGPGGLRPGTAGTVSAASIARGVSRFREAVFGPRRRSWQPQAVLGSVRRPLPLARSWATQAVLAAAVRWPFTVARPASRFCRHVSQATTSELATKTDE